MKSINSQTTSKLQATLVKLKSDFKSEQNNKDMETASIVYKTLIKQVENELNSRLK